MTDRYERFQGVFALLLTPFQPNGDIDWQAYDRYVDWQLAGGPHGIFASCGSSELRHLTLHERLALTRRAVERAGQTPVVAVANAEPERGSHPEEVKQMLDTGVSGVVFIPPDGVGHDQKQLGDYFAELAEISTVPVVLYEIPSSKPKEIAPATYGRLVRETRVCGIKDTSGTLAGTLAKVEQAPQSVVYQAVAPFLLETIRAGGRGAMVIVSTASARLVVNLWNQARADVPAAVESQRRLTYLNALFELGYTATAKYLASLSGAKMDLYCRTGRTLSAVAAKSIETWYEQYGSEQT